MFGVRQRASCQRCRRRGSRAGRELPCWSTRVGVGRGASVWRTWRGWGVNFVVFRAWEKCFYCSDTLVHLTLWWLTGHLSNSWVLLLSCSYTGRKLAFVCCQLDLILSAFLCLIDRSPEHLLSVSPLMLLYLLHWSPHNRPAVLSSKNWPNKRALSDWPFNRITDSNGLINWDQPNIGQLCGLQCTC